ncbi:MAG: hypothetical protein CSA62_13900 [Planctomycetota bacterium]|nr:MAG: hypothetical protein CSA62_13900 [Planctomycetota bacterium]
MALKGDLTSVGLADVFQMLALNQKVGILSIFDADHWRALYFDRRGVTLYYNEHVFLDRLLDGLMQRGQLVGENLDVFRRENSGDPIATVESMLGAGVLAEELFLDGFREQMEEDVYDLFLWENVHWEFHEGVDELEGREGVINENFFLSPDSLVMEAARRLDEWAFLREQVPGPLEIYEPDPSIDAGTVSELDDFSLSVLDFVDGRRNVARIIEMSGVTPFHVYKGLSQLVTEGLILPVPDTSLLDMANSCIGEGRVEDGIYLLEKAIQNQVGLPDAYLMAAQGYETQDEYAKAVYHYKLYSNACVEEYEWGLAEGTLSHCVDLLPTDLDVRERWLRVLAQMESPPIDPMEVGRKLIDIFLDLDETDRARQVLETLLQVAPEDIELKKSLVTIHSKAGDQKRVMELYESIAQDLVQQKDPIGAVRYLQKILMLDRTRKDISDRVKQLYVMDERYRSRRRSVALAFAGIFCFGAIGVLFYLYEQHVQSVFRTLDPETFIAERNYDGAIKLYRDFQREYPLSLISGEIDVAIAGIEAKKQEYVAEKKRLAADRRKAAKRNRTLYRRIYAQYEAMSSVGGLDRRIDLERAIDLLEEVAELIEKAGEPQDFNFRKEKEIEAALRDQRNYLVQARSLREKLGAALAAGNFEDARQIAIRMHEEYPHANNTHKTLVPMQFCSQPSGAELWSKGVQLVDDTGKVVRTPAYVQVPYEEVVRFELRMDGYEPLEIATTGKAKSPRRVVLPVRPERVIPLGEEVVTGVAVGQELGVVGLKEGRLLAFSMKDGQAKFRLRLPGLDEVQGTPLVNKDQAVFATSGGLLCALNLKDGKSSWTAQVPGGVQTRILKMSGGAVVGTGSGELRYYSLRDGEPIWTVPVGGAALLPPLSFQDRVWVANREGQLLCVAEDDGEIVDRWELPQGLHQGPILLPESKCAYLLSDGRVQSYSLRERRVLWEKKFDTYGGRGHLLFAQGWLFVADRKGVVYRIDPGKGAIELERALLDPLDGASFASDQRIYVGTQGEDRGPRIVALRVPDLEICWSYSLGKRRGAKAELQGRSVLAEIDGKVHVLR